MPKKILEEFPWEPGLELFFNAFLRNSSMRIWLIFGEYMGNGIIQLTPEGVLQITPWRNSQISEENLNQILDEYTNWNPDEIFKLYLE